MKLPLNVRWNYHLHSQKRYVDGHFVNEPLYAYGLINGDDNLYFPERSIKISQLEQFLKSLSFTSDFENPIYAERDKQGIQSIEIVPGIRFYIRAIYHTLSYENNLSFNILRQSKDIYLLNILKESYHTDTHGRSEKKESRYLTNSEVTDMFSKLPETIELGIFKLPFGNCFECEPLEN